MMSHLHSRAGELKTQGAVKAAQDPKSDVAAEDAEKIITEESKKAGLAAFQFDPDATPEEKAAQARARVPEGFHRERKPKGVGIATDIDDGQPDAYDLPPPSTDGVIPLSPPPDGKSAIANGHTHKDDAARYAKVGWAPRFGQGEISPEEAGVSLSDRSTLLESKLDDKFFGDWYHNAAVIGFACLSSWLVAVLGGGLGWVFLVMAACATYYRTSIRRTRRNFRDDVNREMAKSRLETDNESLEWINSFLVKFWPIYQPVLCETIVNSVDQVLSTSTPAFLDSMRLKTFTLGSKPPRMEHVKTYPKAEDDTVLMDWKFSFTPNDTMDLTARQLKNKINPKVVLEIRVGKAMISHGMDIIVEDFAFSGLMRVKVKLQIPFPHIEKVEICFLEKPDIDYVCKPLGGDTFGFDINFVPGLEGFIKDQIHGNIGPIMYDPNVFPIEIAKMLAGNPVDQAIGVVAITIHGAQGLKNPDKLAGTPDPYAVASLNGRDALGKTKTIKENASPRWNETLYIILTSLKDALTLQVYDWNEYRKDKELGTATFPLDQLETQTEHENLQMEVMANGKARGLIQADVRYFPVMEGRKLEDGSMEPPPESNTGIARFTIEQAKDLDGTKSLVGQLSPYAAIILNGKEVHQTRKLKRTNNPIWDNGSKEFLITDRKAARLGVVLKDDRDLGTDPILGTYQIKLDDMMQLMDKGQEWYNLAGAKTGRAKMMVQWKPVALKGAIGGSGGYITPIGVLRFHFQNARDLRNVETMGKSDPYVRVMLSGIEKGKTVTFQNNLNPDWDEIVYVPVHSTREKLTLEVMDQENMGKDRTLGHVEVAAGDYIKEGENGEYAVHDMKTPIASPLRIGRNPPKGTLNYTVAFYPALPVMDPEEEAAENAMLEEANKPKGPDDAVNGTNGTAQNDAAGTRGSSEKTREAGKIDTSLQKALSNNEKEQEETQDVQKGPSKIKLSPEELVKYESGLLVFQLVEGTLAYSDVRVEVVMDDMVFPSFSSAKAKTKQVQFGETGDAMVRELDVSKITLRLKAKQDKKGEEHEESTIAKLQGQTLQTLQKCLYKNTELVMKGQDGSLSRITVNLKYLPIKMHLDPSESINNMGTLRVDVLDAADLPAADRNGFSDPFCKFRLNDKEIYKTKIQKKTLHPAWNEVFECPVASRTAARFHLTVFDWDMGDKDDLLGEADINLNLLEPFRPQEATFRLDGKSGAVRLKMLFKPDYVTRSRQGSSTFSGTFATPGKIVGAPVKGVGMVGGGVVKGASFLRHGFKSSKSYNKEHGVNGYTEDETANGDPGMNMNTPQRAPTLNLDDSSAMPAGGAVATPPPMIQRGASFGGASTANSPGGGTPGASDAPSGQAMFMIQAASGYPPGAKVQVHIKQSGIKGGSKEVHKTKAIKVASEGSNVEFAQEMFRVTCSPDTQFQIVVKDDKLLGGHELGEAIFFINDSQQQLEKNVKVGDGSILLTTTFLPADDAATGTGIANGGGGAAAGGSPKSVSRRSFLSKRVKEDRHASGTSMQSQQ